MLSVSSIAESTHSVLDIGVIYCAVGSKKKKMKHFAPFLILCGLSFGLVCCAVQNSTEHSELSVDSDGGKILSGVPSLLARFAVRAMLMKIARAFAQYFVDIFLGEVIGARGLADDTWSFQWPTWLLTGVKSE